MTLGHDLEHGNNTALRFRDLRFFFGRFYGRFRGVILCYRIDGVHGKLRLIYRSIVHLLLFLFARLVFQIFEVVFLNRVQHFPGIIRKIPVAVEEFDIQVDPFFFSYLFVFQFVYFLPQ